MDLQDQIRPENRVSNISGRGSFTSCIVKSERRSAAAKKLLALRKESTHAEIEAKMKQKRFNDKLEFEQRKRELELEETKLHFEFEERKRQLELEEKKQKLELEEKKQIILRSPGPA